MINYDYKTARSMLYYQMYLKTHNRVNEISESPSEPVPEEHIDDEDEISFCNFVPQAINKLIEATSLDAATGEYYEFLNHMFTSVEHQFQLEIPGLFHFGLLKENEHLFEPNEIIHWKTKWHFLFGGISSMNVLDFYERYFKTQFWGGDKECFTKHTNMMSYSQVIVCDLGYHTIDDFGPRFMINYAEFAQNYRNLYEKLVWEIQLRK